VRATRSHNDESWTDEFPRDRPPDAYRPAYHLLNITAEPSRAFTHTRNRCRN